MRAAIADMAPPDRRASAYGVLNAAYGFAWFVGSALMGWLYDVSPPMLIAFSGLGQAAAVPPFVGSGRKGLRERSLIARALD